MNSFVKHAGIFLLNEIGNPVAVKEVLKNIPNMRVETLSMPRNIASGSLVKWCGWGQPNDSLSTQRLWGATDGPYQCKFVQIESLKNLTIKDEMPSWCCDIQQVEGFCASKAPLEELSSLEEMVLKRCPGYVADLSIDGLKKNLAHDEIRIIHRARHSDFFQRFAWDGRVFLMNDGGSHHFAAAQYIAKRINQPVELSGRLVNHRINDVAVRILNHQYDMFVLNSEPAKYEFWDAMKIYGAPYITIDMPRPLNDEMIAVFLPKDNKLSLRVSNLLKEYSHFNLGSHLTNLATSADNWCPISRVGQNHNRLDDEDDAPAPRM